MTTKTAENDAIKSFKRKKGKELAEQRKVKKKRAEVTEIESNEGKVVQSSTAGAVKSFVELIQKGKGSNKPEKKHEKKKELKSILKKTEEKINWKLVKQERKEVKEKRKAADRGGKDIYAVIVRAKQIWEEVRRDDCDPDRKYKLCEELFKLVRGKVNQFIYNHDTVRIVETLIAAGIEKHQMAIFNELKGEILSLTKSQYARFFILKVLRYGSPEQKFTIIRAFKGNAVKLTRSRISASVLEVAFNDFANSQQRMSMIQEFYGKKFSLFQDEEVKTLKQFLEKYPDDKMEILEEIDSNLLAIVGKGLIIHTLVQAVVKEFMPLCSDFQRNELVNSIHENLVPIVHSKDGSRIGMYCFWYGNQKIRKAILKSMSDHVVKIATTDNAYYMLLCALDCIDDTVVLNKTILSKLKPHIGELIVSDYGLKVIEFIMFGHSKIFFPPDMISILAQGDGNPFSLKDRETRAKEVRQYGVDAVTDYVAAHTMELAKNPRTVLFLASMINHCTGDELDSVLKELASICQEPYIPGDKSHFMEMTHTYVLLKRIIKADKQRFQDKKETLSERLAEASIEVEGPSWIGCNRGCFLLVHLWETEIPVVQDAIVLALDKHMKKIENSGFTGASFLTKYLSR